MVNFMCWPAGSLGTQIFCYHSVAQWCLTRLQPQGLQLARLPCPWDLQARVLEWVATLLKTLFPCVCEAVYGWDERLGQQTEWRTLSRGWASSNRLNRKADPPPSKKNACLTALSKDSGPFHLWVWTETSTCRMERTPPALLVLWPLDCGSPWPVTADHTYWDLQTPS